MVLVRKDNGKHRGWFKNSKSHQGNTKPGKRKGNHEENPQSFVYPKTIIESVDKRYITPHTF
jgi:hypothetical protein